MADNYTEGELPLFTYIVIGGGIAGVTCTETVSFLLKFIYCALDVELYGIAFQEFCSENEQ